MKDKDFDADKLLDKLFEPIPPKVEDSLEELFGQRLLTLKVTRTAALKLMGMEVRTLKGIFTGQQKILDYSQLIKLANFLGLSVEKVGLLYLENVQRVHRAETKSKVNYEMIEFVNERFNLAELKRVGLIKSLTDYDEIVNSICLYFGLENIFDYKAPDINIAFSAGKRAKSSITIENWIYLAQQVSIELRNSNKFDKTKLVDFFPQIRWYSMNVEQGLLTVINNLFQLGITVVFIPSFPSLHIRGATFCVNDKPVIAITDYVGFYPTLWFALIHELYHVLFDWEDILISDYHISLDSSDLIGSNSQNEKDANEFARKYLFSREKTKEVSSFIKDEFLVRDYTESNHVHPSFAYVFNAWDSGKTNKYAWSRAHRNNPNIDKLKAKLERPFGGVVTFNEHIKYLRNNIYN